MCAVYSSFKALQELNSRILPSKCFGYKRINFHLFLKQIYHWSQSYIFRELCISLQKQSVGSLVHFFDTAWSTKPKNLPLPVPHPYLTSCDWDSGDLPFHPVFSCSLVHRGVHDLDLVTDVPENKNHNFKHFGKFWKCNPLKAWERGIISQFCIMWLQMYYPVVKITSLRWFQHNRYPQYVLNEEKRGTYPVKQYLQYQAHIFLLLTVKCTSWLSYKGKNSKRRSIS